MNPRDRLLATLRGEAHDRVPLHLSRFVYRTLNDVKDEAKRQIAERIIDQAHYLVSCPSYSNRCLVTPPQRMKEVDRSESNGEVTITSEIDTPKGKLTTVTGTNPTTNTIWTIKYPCESLEDIEKIRSVPWELPPKLSPPDLSDLPPDFGERGIIATNISSPFVCVAGTMPYEYFLMLCKTELNLLKELSGQCLERTLSLLDVVLGERSVEYASISGCEWVTPPMASPEVYDALVQAFEQRVIERIHEGGALCHVHCHGRVRSTLELVIERGGDFFEPVEPPPDGDITFAEAKRLAAGRMALGGNIEARVIENENADVVEQAVRAAFEGGKKRMVLQTTAGPVGAITPRIVENYNRMIDVWEELSPM